jgi:membrane protease YdiL (CAAX protease family)
MTSSDSDDRFAAELRGFGPIGIVAILVILAGQLVAPLSAVLVLVWVQLSHTPWREIGYVRPRNWVVDVVAGIVFGIVYKFALKAVVMPLLGADPINHTYHYLVGNAPAAAAEVVTLIVVGGFAEETVFRGYLFERFGKLLGQSLGAKIVTVVITTLFFASLHYFDQGSAGVEQAIFTGAAFGTIYSVTGRIWTVMCAHAAFDLTALAMIYWNVEPAIAHFFFK